MRQVDLRSVSLTILLQVGHSDDLDRFRHRVVGSPEWFNHHFSVCSISISYDLVSFQLAGFVCKLVPALCQILRKENICALQPKARSPN